LKGIDRTKGTAVQRKTPITPEVLERMRQKINCACSDDVVFWSACLIMFFGLFRKSNLFSSRGPFDPSKQFTRADFTLNTNKSLTIRVRWSKTIQFKERSQLVTLPVIHPHPLCAVSALCRAWQKCGPQPDTAPAFPISARQFDSKLRTLVQTETGHITSHSFRRGGAAHALVAGIPGEVIQRFGDWKSMAYLSYLDHLPQSILDYYRVLFSQSLPR
jgi:hypothetical protein